VLGLVAQLFCSFILACSWQYFGSGRKIERVKEFLTHFNAILIIFILSAKWLMRGLDAEESSADTLNIFFNGHFEYSMHARWYDLAPVDSLIKVVLLNIFGDNNPYSPIETFMVSFLSSLSLYFIVYSYMRDKRFLSSLIPLIPALLMVHPYAFLSSVYLTPHIASALALMSIIVFLKFQKVISRSILIVTKVLILTSVLAHPYSIIVLIFVGVTLLSKYMDAKIFSGREVWFSISILIIWIAKMTLTAAIYGVISIYDTIFSGLFSIAERKELLAVRNLGYLALPKLALASFSASLGIIGGVSVRHLSTVAKGRSNQRWCSFWIIIFAGITGLLSLLGAFGGYSVYILVPSACLFFVSIILHFEGKDPPSRYFLALIMISAILTSLTPKIIADQYSLSTASKLSDKTMFTIASSVFDRLNPKFIVDRFYGLSKTKLYLVQESEFSRTYGDSGLIVEKIILSGIVKAKTYWDFVGRGPLDTFNGTLDYDKVNVIFDSSLAKIVAAWSNR
jgi:hypothetical protein